MIYSALKFATKVGAVGGAVYLSINSGIWSKDTTNNAVAVREFTNSVEGRLGVDYSSKIARPTADTLAGVWNGGVNAVFEKASDLPQYLSDKYTIAKDKLSNATK